MISVTLDDSRARTILNDLQRATGEDMATLIHTEEALGECLHESLCTQKQAANSQEN